MTDKTQMAIDATIISGANKATAGGAAATAFGWFSQSNVISLIGLALAVSGFLISLYFQIKRDRRETELHLARMGALHEDSTDD